MVCLLFGLLLQVSLDSSAKAVAPLDDDPTAHTRIPNLKIDAPSGGLRQKLENGVAVFSGLSIRAKEAGQYDLRFACSSRKLQLEGATLRVCVVLENRVVGVTLVEEHIPSELEAGSCVEVCCFDFAS